MSRDKRILRLIKWMVIYLSLGLGMIWLHDPRHVSMDAAASTVKFVYQQF